MSGEDSTGEKESTLGKILTHVNSTTSSISRHPSVLPSSTLLYCPPPPVTLFYYKNCVGKQRIWIIKSQKNLHNHLSASHHLWMSNMNLYLLYTYNAKCPLHRRTPSWLIISTPTKFTINTFSHSKVWSREMYRNNHETLCRGWCITIPSKMTVLSTSVALTAVSCHMTLFFTPKKVKNIHITWW